MLQAMLRACCWLLTGCGPCARSFMHHACSRPAMRHTLPCPMCHVLGHAHAPYPMPHVLGHAPCAIPYASCATCWGPCPMRHAPCPMRWAAPHALGGAHLDLGVRKARGDLGHDERQALGHLARRAAGQHPQCIQRAHLGLPALGLHVRREWGKVGWAQRG